MANIEEKVENLISKNIIDLGYELYDVQYTKEGSDYYLKIFIEKKEGINIEDCEKVSREITEILDEKDYIKEQYFLEVSSTGVEKVLRKDKHLKDNINKEIVIRLYKPIDKEKEITGILKNINNENIVLKTQNGEKEIERKNISLIKKYYDWDNLGGNE